MVECSEHVFDGVVSGVVSEEVARLRFRVVLKSSCLLNIPFVDSEARVLGIKSSLHDPSALDFDRSIGVDSEVLLV